MADQLRALATQAGFDARAQDDAGGEVPWLLVDCGADPEGEPLQGGPVALLLADGSLHALDGGGGAVGFHVLPPLEAAAVVELTRDDATADVAADRAEELFRALGRRTRLGRRRARAGAWGASPHSSSTRRPSRWPRAWARPTTSTRAWCWA